MEGYAPTSATSHPRTMPSPRSIRPSGSVETFWEPGGDLIHYQDGNNRYDIPVRFLVTMLRDPDNRCAPLWTRTSSPSGRIGGASARADRSHLRREKGRRHEDRC